MRAKAMLFAILVLGTGVILAQEQPVATPQSETKTPVVNQRQKNQHARIKQGVKSGELTKGEAAKLHSEEKAIKEEKQMAKTDGKVTAAERAKLRKDQNKASKDIYRLKHNKRTAKDSEAK